MRKKNVAILLGGCSNERHVSVESGRNVYEKLSCSELYNPIPIFVVVEKRSIIKLFKLPLSLLYKDNADDIREILLAPISTKKNDILESIIANSEFIRMKYKGKIDDIQEIFFENLPVMVDFVFIALHGHPGEDGVIQNILNVLHLPYNGSDAESSWLTMNKFQTNKFLKEKGFLVPKNVQVKMDAFRMHPMEIRKQLSSQLRPPYILKPISDGCSAGIKKFNDLKTLEEHLISSFCAESNEYEEFMIEEFVGTCDGANERVMEITCGFFTFFYDGSLQYEFFSPSEAIRSDEILSLEEKFLLGWGRNITPAIFHNETTKSLQIETEVKLYIEKAVRLLKTEGYGRVDAFVKISKNGQVQVIILEVNSLPAMTPSTCIFHQCILAGYSPLNFIHKIIDFGLKKMGADVI